MSSVVQKSSPLQVHLVSPWPRGGGGAGKNPLSILFMPECKYDEPQDTLHTADG